ncbi:hypothetical protein HPULCUR_003515 [Helicostylum pulchrum]|uniref:Uncharacterized protein n=1 Tax=Helicostylum pulchrum TaxID=562976 RepID=A0ABP9XUW3_9FUNG
MYNYQPDKYCMLSLPEVFVNLKKLIWISDIPSDVEFPRKPIYIQQFQNWNALEDISCSSKDYDHIALYLLKSSVLPRLTPLEMQTVRNYIEIEPPNTL